MTLVHNELLADQGVRRWALAYGVSQLGDQVWLIALAWTAVRLGGPGLASLALISAAVPKGVFMLVGGAVADRVSLRRLMLLCDGARTAVLVVAALLLWADGTSSLLLIAISICFGVAEAAYMPAAGAFCAEMVAPEQQVPLAGLRQLIGRGATLAGAPLGGAIVALGGFQAAVVADAASFAVIGLILLRLRPRYPRTQVIGARPSVLSEVRDGLGYIRRCRPVRDLTLALSGLNVFVTPVLAVGLAQHASRSGWGSSRLGILTGLIGAGAAVGTVAAMRWRPRQGVRSALMILLPQAAALASVGVAGFPEAAVAMLTVGITAGLASPLLGGAFQSTVDKAYLGRCNSVVAVSDAGLTPLALALFGWTAAATGVAAPCVAFGLAFACLLGVSLTRMRGDAHRTVPGQVLTDG